MVTDFVEQFFVRQLDADTYTYCWSKIDLADGSCVNHDWEEVCSGEELFDALEFHGFDTDRVFKHFEDYPLSSIMVEEDY